MNCIFCGEDTHVTDKREAPEGERRRRECLKCKKRFTTYEKSEPLSLYVIKKDGRREFLDGEKIKGGLINACEKRSIPIDVIDHLVGEIIEITRKKGKEASSDFIGQTVLNKLKELDKIAYIRFASVHKAFKDIEEFKKEINEL